MNLPAILDVEASGFGRGSYPIEVGFVDTNGGLFCSLIQPEPDWQHWDASAEALHGISRATLLRHGRPARWVAQQLNERLGEAWVVSDAWGCDYSWLARLFDAADLLPRFKLLDLRSLLNEDEAPRWHGVLSQVRLESPQRRHRASNDAQHLRLALQRLRQSEVLPVVGGRMSLGPA